MDNGQAAILCGGLGKRLRPLTETVPKPMVDVNGAPFLEHLVQQLIAQGVTRIVLMTGYLGDQIREHFGTGQRYGCDIIYSHGSESWSTGRRLLEARASLDERFFLLYADNFALVDLQQLLTFHLREGSNLTLMLAPKAHGNIGDFDNGRIGCYDPDRTVPDLDHVEIGYMVANRDPLLSVLGELADAPDTNLSDAMQRMVVRGEVAGVPVVGGYYSISDPERLEQTRDYFSPKKLLLIDRDGVVNHRADCGEYISYWDDFQFIDDALAALGSLARHGFRFIVISNQAGISRGMVDPQDLEDIHHKMVRTMARQGIDVVGVYVSPHHWDEGSPMRKPEPGMFLQASKEHLFRLDHVLYVGDDLRDCQAAANAGCGMVFLGEPPLREDMPPTGLPQRSFMTFTEAVPFIVDHYSGNLP